MGINQGPISLDQKYTQGSGHVFLTGIQALVRLPMAQIRRDRAAGLNTAGSSRATAVHRSAATTSNWRRRERTSNNTASSSSPP